MKKQASVPPKPRPESAKQRQSLVILNNKSLVELEYDINKLIEDDYVPKGELIIGNGVYIQVMVESWLGGYEQ